MILFNCRSGVSGVPDIDRIRSSVVDAADGLIAIQAGEVWEQPYAPTDGWDWGSNGRIANNLIVIATAHELTGAARHRDGLVNGLGYLFDVVGIDQQRIGQFQRSAREGAQDQHAAIVVTRGHEFFGNQIHAIMQ